MKACSVCLSPLVRERSRLAVILTLLTLWLAWAAGPALARAAPLAGPVTRGEVELTVLQAYTTPLLAGEKAGQGQRFLCLDLKVRYNGRGKGFSRNPAAGVVLLENRSVRHALHGLSYTLSPALGHPAGGVGLKEMRLKPVFLIPEKPGRLELAALTRAGLLMVELPADIQASPEADPAAASLVKMIKVEDSDANPADNKALTIRVTGWARVDEYAGRRAGEGRQLLVVRGELIPKSKTKGTSLPPIEKCFSVIMADGSIIPPHPISKSSAFPLWGEVILRPGRTRPFELVFGVPSGELKGFRLHHLGSQGAVTVAVGQVDQPGGDGVIASGEMDQTEIAVAGLEMTGQVAGTAAPKGRAFAVVDLRVTNRRDLQPLQTVLTDFLVLVEEGQYIHSPSPLTAKVSGLMAETRFPAGVAVSGKVVFALPAKPGNLELIHFTGQGRLTLNLTPDRTKPAPPEPAAGPAGDGLIRLGLYKAEEIAEVSPPAAGERLVVVDVSLELIHTSPTASLRLDTGQALRLKDDQGRVFAPAPETSGLERGLEKVDLWSRTPARGRVAFRVPQGAKGLTVEIPLRSGPVSLAIPAGMLAPAVAKVPKEAEAVTRTRTELSLDVLSPPAETKPTEVQPVDVKPVEVKPADVKPTEVKPAEVKPVEVKPVEIKPAETKPPVADIPAVVVTDKGLAAGRNLALRFRGGRIMTSLNTKAPANLIDGQLGWKSEAVLEKLPAEVVIGFHADTVPLIERVNLHNYTWHQVLLSRVEVLVSTDTVEGPYEPVGPAYALPAEKDKWLSLSFKPRRAKYVKIRLLAAHGPGAAGFNELQIIEASGPGYTSVMAPLTAAETGPEGGDRQAELHRERDIAAAFRGGKVVSAKGATTPEHMLDGVFGWKSEARFGPGSGEVVLGFYGDEAAEIEQVNLHTYTWHGTPANMVQLAWSATSAQGPFTDIGPPVLLINRKKIWQTIRFKPVRARYLKITFIGSYGGDKSGLDQLQVIETARSGYISILARTADCAEELGLNIANAALGGRIISATPGAQADWPPEKLIDGQVSSTNGSMTNSWGWSSAPDQKEPPEIVFGFVGDAVARLTGFAINPMTRLAQLGGLDSSWHGSRKDWVRFVEVWTSATSPDSGWQRVPGQWEVANRRALQRFCFAAPVKARYVKLRLTGNYGGRHYQLGEVEIYETAQRNGYRSVTAGAGVNIVDLRLGGVVVSFSSWTSGHPVAGLIDGDAATSWLSWKDRLPQRFLFAFRDWRTALVDRVVISPAKPGQVEGWPKRIKITATRERNPLQGHQTVGVFELNDRAEARTIRFAAPVPARFLRLTVMERHGGKQTAIGGVSIIEADRSGYSSVAGVKGGLADPVPAAVSAAAVAADQPEREANDDPSHATPLPLGRTVSGKIATPDDVDWFLMDLSGSNKGAVNVTLTGRPDIKTYLIVQDPSGQQVAGYDPGRAADSEIFTWQLSPQGYHLKLFRPRTSVVLLFDDSGSMRPRVADLRLAADRYIGDKQPYEDMAVVKFAKSVTLLHDFSADRDSLRAAVAEKLAAAGATALYDGVADALERLRTRKGNRAVVILSDGADTRSRNINYMGLWPRIIGAGVRIYAVGLGEDLNVFNRKLGTTMTRMLEAWSLATGGRYLAAPSSEDLMKVYADISADLQAPPVYTLKAELPRGTGRLNVLEVGERLTGVTGPSRLMLILDGSGSMNGRIKGPGGGVPKIKVAKEVMRRIVTGLPGELNVGLRIYGSRQPRSPKARSCKDSVLVVPFGPLNREALLKEIYAIRPRGQTPIGYSLRLAAKDFGQTKGPKMVILVTDGIESCDEGPNSPNYPPKVVSELLTQGMDLKLNIVGFDITASATRDYLAGIASMTGGELYTAESAAQLEQAIRRAMSVPFHVVNANGKRVASHRVGHGPVELPEGRYNVGLASSPPLVIPKVDIHFERETRILLDKEGREVGVERRETALDAPLPPGARVTAAAPAAAASTSPSTAAPAARTSPEDRAGLLLAEAEGLMEARKLTTPRGDSALDRYQSVLAIDPANAEARAGITKIVDTYLGWARSAAKRGQPGKAIKYCRRALSIDPDRADIHSLTGQLLEKTGDLKGAGKAYARAVELDPGDGTAKAGLARVRTALERPPDSIPAPELKKQLLVMSDEIKRRGAELDQRYSTQGCTNLLLAAVHRHGDRNAKYVDKLVPDLVRDWSKVKKAYILGARAVLLSSALKLEKRRFVQAGEARLYRREMAAWRGAMKRNVEMIDILTDIYGRFLNADSAGRERTKSMVVKTRAILWDGLETKVFHELSSNDPLARWNR